MILDNSASVVRPNTRNLMVKWWIFSFILRFLKKYAFGKNFIRTKFILHKIFSQMSILSSKETSYMFFNLHSKMTLLHRDLDFWRITDRFWSVKIEIAKIGAIDNRPSKNQFSFIKKYNSVAGTWQTRQIDSF